jgi:hypothetical protein
MAIPPVVFMRVINQPINGGAKLVTVNLKNLDGYNGDVIEITQLMAF